MPLFDYRCGHCRRRFSLLVGVVAERQEEKCLDCGSRDVTRMISRFGRVRSEDDLIDDLADPSKMGDLEDPKQLHSWMKRAGKEMGEELGDDFEEVLEEIERGEGEEPSPALDDD